MPVSAKSMPWTSSASADRFYSSLARCERVDLNGVITAYPELVGLLHTTNGYSTKVVNKGLHIPLMS